jgi:hypothetical protein
MKDIPDLEDVAKLSPRLKSLLRRHSQLNEEVDKLNNRPFLTAEEAAKLKNLKLEKLKIKEEVLLVYNALKSSLNFESRQQVVNA